MVFFFHSTLIHQQDGESTTQTSALSGRRRHNWMYRAWVHRPQQFNRESAHLLSLPDGSGQRFWYRRKRAPRS